MVTQMAFIRLSGSQNKAKKTWVWMWERDMRGEVGTSRRKRRRFERQSALYPLIQLSCQRTNSTKVTKKEGKKRRERKEGNRSQCGRMKAVFLRMRN